MTLLEQQHKLQLKTMNSHPWVMPNYSLESTSWARGYYNSLCSCILYTYETTLFSLLLNYNATSSDIHSFLITKSCVASYFGDETAKSIPACVLTSPACSTGRCHNITCTVFQHLMSWAWYTQTAILHSYKLLGFCSLALLNFHRLKPLVN